jgi:hypothetical protein
MLLVKQRASSIALNGIEQRADNYFRMQEAFAFAQTSLQIMTGLSREKKRESWQGRHLPLE